MSDRTDFVSDKFDGFTLEELNKDPDERIQIAFRLAHQLGQKSVYGIDEQSNTIDCFPFDKVDTYAKGHQQSAALGRMQEKVAEIIKQMEAAQKTKTVRLMLAVVNDPARVLSDHQNFYYALLSLGNEKEQPGAELNAAWYQLNAKIFAKLTQIAQPGDRALVVFGSGHAFWLRHFVQNTPGFQLIEPGDYLRQIENRFWQTTRERSWSHVDAQSAASISRTVSPGKRLSRRRTKRGAITYFPSSYRY